MKQQSQVPHALRSYIEIRTAQLQAIFTIGGKFFQQQILDGDRAGLGGQELIGILDRAQPSRNDSGDVRVMAQCLLNNDIDDREDISRAVLQFSDKNLIVEFAAP